MALNAGTLATAMKPDIKAAFIALGALDNALLDALALGLATAIASKTIAHITANAQVITTCGAGAGTGTVT